MFNILKTYITFRMIHPFYLRGCKLKKLKKNVVNLYGKKEYVIQSRNLKHLLNHGTVLKKVHSVTKFNQKY